MVVETAEVDFLVVEAGNLLKWQAKTCHFLFKKIFEKDLTISKSCVILSLLLGQIA